MVDIKLLIVFFFLYRYTAIIAYYSYRSFKHTHLIVLLYLQNRFYDHVNDAPKEIKYFYAI